MRVWRLLIKRIEIKNFKSIESMTLDLKRINIFIGKPETGKSNILEVFGSISFLGWVPVMVKALSLGTSSHEVEVEGKKLKLCKVYSSDLNLKRFVRFSKLEDLYFRFSTEKDVTINILGEREVSLKLKYEEGNVLVKLFSDKSEEVLAVIDSQGMLSYNEHLVRKLKLFSKVKFYGFGKFVKTISHYGELLPPDGSNLLHVLRINGELRKHANHILESLGLKLMIMKPEGELRIIEEMKPYGELLAIPLELLSDTLRGVLLMLAAVKTNKGATIIFEEPEVHMFPFYVKFLAEKICMDKRNQYVISTHNPYLLLTFVEKVPLDELNVYLTSREEGVTKVVALDRDAMRKLLEFSYDVFVNLDELMRSLS